MKQNNLMIIGLTGGIATGKSTVSKILSKKGFSIIDADNISKEVVERGKDAYLEIVNFFGKEILLENREINRKKLGRIIFSDKNSREVLNNIVHPYVFKEIKKQIEKLSQDNQTIFLDVPLLLEQYKLWKEYDIEFYEIWLVYCDESTQIKRLMDRDNISKDDAVKKINSQMSLERKKGMSSKIIDNSKDIEYLKKQIEELVKTL